MAFQRFPNSKQLSADLNSGKFEKIYLFLGKEEGEKEKIINKIIDKMIKNNDEKKYSTARFHIENDELVKAAEFALSESMFSEKKVCVMLNVNSIKSRGEDKDLLSEMINTLPDSNILIMTSPENKLPEIIYSKDLKAVKTVQFWQFFDNDITGYIQNSIRKKGIEIKGEGIRQLINLTGKDIKKIDEALEMIINSGEKTITSEIINKYINDNKDVSIFEFVDSLFKKDKSAFLQLSKVLDNGIHELVLLKLIMRQAELIEEYLNLVKNNTDSETAMQEIGINPGNSKNFIDCIGCFSLESIKSVFPFIYRADQKIKSSNYSSSLVSNPIFELVSNILVNPSN